VLGPTLVETPERPHDIGRDQQCIVGIDRPHNGCPENRHQPVAQVLDRVSGFRTRNLLNVPIIDTPARPDNRSRPPTTAQGVLRTRFRE
jgi:hypothetical protein